MLLRRGKGKILALISFLTLSSFLGGCAKKEAMDSSSVSSSSSPEASSVLGESSSEVSSFPRDEDGFKIFDESYFKPPMEDDGKATSEVRFADYVEGRERYQSIKMYLAGEEVPVYKVAINENRVWKADAGNRNYAAYASFSLKGKAKVFLKCAFNPLDDVVIRPLGMNVPYEVDRSRFVISFWIDTPGQYVIETRYRTLHLFVNALEEESLGGAIVFKKGIHNKDNDSRIDKNNVIHVHNGERIYLEDGALIQGRFLANGASDFSISGPGVIDGSIFPRNPEEGTATIPLEFNFCSDFSLSDFLIADPAGWAYNLYFCERVKIRNTKTISSRSNGDGISVQSCKDVEADGCFLRTWDDTLVVKNYVDYRNQSEGSTAHISFSNCLLITDLAQSMEVGYETIGEQLEDVSFKNITVLHACHKAVMSIHNGNNAKIKDVTYEGITVEDCATGKGDGNPYLFDFDCSYSPTWSDNHKKTPLGEIDGVKVSNVLVLDGIDSPKVKITGSLEKRSVYPQEAHYVKNVSFKDVSIYGKELDESYSSIDKEYAENVTFSNEGSPTGASYKRSDVSSFGDGVVRLK